MATLVVAAEEDSNRLIERGRPSKARTSVNEAIHFALCGIRANNPATHPIDLQKLDFHLFTSGYLKESFSKKVETNATDAIVFEVLGEWSK